MNSNLVKQWGRRASVMGLMAVMVMSALAANSSKPIGPRTDGVSILDASAPNLYLITTGGNYHLTNDVGCIHVRPAENVSVPLEVTIDLQGHSVSNVCEDNAYQLISCGEDTNFIVKTTCTLTNSSTARVSYLDGLNVLFNGRGRGIFNDYSGVFHFDGGTNIVIRRCFLKESKSSADGYWGAGICNRGTFYMTGGVVGEAATTNENGLCNYTLDAHGGGIFNGQRLNRTMRECSNQTKFYMTGGSVQYCGCLGRHGGGISNQGWDSLFVAGGEGKGVVISHNTARSGAGIMTGNTSTLILTNNVEISFNTATGTNSTLSGGGISIGSGGDIYGGGTNRLFIFNCNIVSNSAQSLGGGGIYMRGVAEGRGRIEMHGGRIAYNTATGVGGGIHTQGPVDMYGGVIESNTSVTNGGGVCIDVDSGTSNSWKQAFTMSGGCIRNNTALDGGGVYTVNEVTISGGAITNNYASQFGGGVCIDQKELGDDAKPFLLQGGIIANNVAKRHGGGFFVRLSPQGDVRLQNGIVTANKAGEQGGGFWYSGVAMTNLVSGETLVASNQAARGGGFFAKDGANLVVDGGTIVANVATNAGGGGFYITSSSGFPASSLVLSNGEVKQNEALGNNGNGGGFYVNKSSVKLTNHVNIEGNRADGNGGGLALVFNDEKNSLLLDGGTVVGNIATNGNGGGFWISGKGSTDSKITGAIEVSGNEAKNGGGFYLNTNAYFTVEGGFVYLNKAVGDPKAKFATAFKGGNGTGIPEGVGGGFYLASGTKDDANYRTTLKFDLKKADIGIFANRADCAADDIAAEGAKLTDIINMPAVTNMVLNKLAGAIIKGWDEDYRTNDSAYAEGTYIVKDEGYLAERYRTVIARGDPPIEATNLVLASSSTGKNVKYMCLTLGYIFPIPHFLWITDHEDLGDGVVNLQFTPCFTNAMDTPLSQWAETAQDGNHLWVVWGNSEEEAISNTTNKELSVNAMCVKLRGEKAKTSVDEDARTVWVTTPFFTSWTHEASSGTNRFYKIVVDDLSEDILKERNQASK